MTFKLGGGIIHRSASQPVNGMSWMFMERTGIKANVSSLPVAMSLGAATASSRRCGNFLCDLEMLHSLSSRLDTGYATDTTADISVVEALRRLKTYPTGFVYLHLSNRSKPSLTLA